MSTYTPLLQQALISQPALCQQLSLTRSGLAKLRKNDPEFPQPVKFGQTRQAAAYYVISEVEAWITKHLAARAAE